MKMCPSLFLVVKRFAVRTELHFGLSIGTSLSFIGNELPVLGYGFHFHSRRCSFRSKPQMGQNSEDVYHPMGRVPWCLVRWTLNRWKNRTALECLCGLKSLERRGLPERLVPKAR